jgi:hypothetical protein
MASSAVLPSVPTLGLLPRPLPHCSYPRARDLSEHGLQPLPERLPLVDFASAEPHRSRRHAAVPLSRLEPAVVLDVAELVATSFARREPQCRHVRPPAEPPAAIARVRHADAFGSELFGPWTPARLLYWFVRLLILTDPTSPRAAIRARPEVLEQSLALFDARGAPIGGAINETLCPPAETPLRSDDPFLDAAVGFVAPVLELLERQDAEGVAALSRHPEFADALARGKVGHHFMVARSDALPKLDAFELVAATAERFRELGHSFVVVEATNQWTGAACEVLGGARVHFAPFRARPVLPASANPLRDEASSPDGHLAAKDSGSMLYVLRVA